MDTKPNVFFWFSSPFSAVSVTDTSCFQIYWGSNHCGSYPSFSAESLRTKSVRCQLHSAGEQQLRAFWACHSELVSISGSFSDSDSRFNMWPQYELSVRSSHSGSLTASNSVVEEEEDDEEEERQSRAFSRRRLLVDL